MIIGFFFLEQIRQQLSIQQLSRSIETQSISIMIIHGDMIIIITIYFSAHHSINHP